MPGIYIAFVLTVLIAVAILGPLIHKLRLPADERLLWLAALVVLPLQPLAFYYVRLPLDHWLVAHLGEKSAWLYWLRTFYAPLTEEPAKLVPLLIPAIRRDIRPENFARYALAIGLGFALGEMWFIADRVAHAPAMAKLPFYLFGGYLAERLMTCVFHSAFVSLSLWRLRRRLVLGFACAATAHWLGNAPILLLALKIPSGQKAVLEAVVQLWLLFYFVAALCLLACFIFGKFVPLRLFFGRRRCSSCHQEYDPPIFGANFGPKRYERCPHCHQWNWSQTVTSAK